MRGIKIPHLGGTPHSTQRILPPLDNSDIVNVIVNTDNRVWSLVGAFHFADEDSDINRTYMGLSTINCTFEE